MHHADLEFQLAQTRRRFAGEEPAAHHHDGFLQRRHLAQGERVPDGAKINHIAEADTGDRGPERPASHGQAGFVELNRLAISQDSEPAIDIDLGDHRREARLDFVLLVPMRVEDRHFLQRRNLVAQKTLREHPALIRREGLGADERDLAALVVFADAFASAAAANAAPDDEIIALNHVQADDRKSVRPLAREKLDSLFSSSGRLEDGPADNDRGDNSRQVAQQTRRNRVPGLLHGH